MLYVQFEDETEEKIISWFPAPQDSGVWPNMGEVDASDPRWHAYYESVGPLTQPILPAPK